MLCMEGEHDVQGVRQARIWPVVPGCAGVEHVEEVLRIAQV